MITLLILACSTDVADVEPASATAETPTPATAPATEDADKGAWTHFGDAFSQEDEVVAAKDLLADPAPFADKKVLVEGRVTEVCQAKGCWMVIADEEKTMRVMMKDHSFTVDMEGAGSDCRVEGVVTAKEVDPELVEHLAGESINPEKMPEAGKEAGSVLYQIEATGVAFKG